MTCNARAYTMQIALTITHSFDDPARLIDFAAKLKALFSDLMAAPLPTFHPAPAVEKVSATNGGHIGAYSEFSTAAMPGGAGAAAPEASAAPSAPSAPSALSEPQKRGRGRPRKEEATTNQGAAASSPPEIAESNVFDLPLGAPAVPAVPAAPAVPTTKPAPVIDPNVTLADVKDAFTDLLMTDGGEVKIKEIMSRFGLAAVKDVKPEQFAAIIADFKAAM